MRKVGVFLGTLSLAVAAISATARAQALNGFPLGTSTSANGVLFTGGNSNGSLSVSIGGCPVNGATCVIGPVTGNFSGSFQGFSGSGNYSLASESLTASFAGEAANGVDMWSFATNADAFSANVSSGLLAGGGVSGNIDWTGITETTSGVFVAGNVTFTGSGTLSALGSGSTIIDLQLAPLSCNTAVTGSCTLANIAGEPGDPPMGFASVGSGVFGQAPPTGSTNPTPEPGTLLLLGSGLTGIGFLRRKFSV